MTSFLGQLRTALGAGPGQSDRLGRLRTASGAGPGQSEEEALSQPGTEPKHFLRPFPSQKKESSSGRRRPPGGGVQIGSNETLGFKSPLKRRFRV